MSTILVSPSDEGLPQRVPRQRRRAPSNCGTTLPESTPCGSISDDPEDPRMVEEHLCNIAEDPSYNEHESGEERRLGDQPVYRSAAEGNFSFEYLDHTADIQIHSWGRNLEEAFASAGLGMYNYLTPLSGVVIDPTCTRFFDVEGHDEQSLLYNFLDELLFVFATEMLVCCEISILHLNRENWKIHACGKGERFERGRHASGTEIKAITYSAMQITEKDNDAEVFVIVDI